MSNESLLKKEFKESDVQRVRNLVNKDFTAKTKVQTGYQKSYKAYSEGDIWEENGKQWTIKNGIKQNITKLDSAKKAVRIPLTCPKCGGSMKHHLAKKMYKVHGFCFDPCTVEYESNLKKAGLFEQYEKRMLSGNIKGFMHDIKAWVMDILESDSSYVTEQGDVEDWGKMSPKFKQNILDNLKEYLNILSKHVE